MPSRFVWESGDLEVVQCSRCEWYRGGGLCIAFPDGIPEEIMGNRFDHRTPYFGDRGIQFSKKKRARAREFA